MPLRALWVALTACVVLSAARPARAADEAAPEATVEPYDRPPPAADTPEPAPSPPPRLRREQAADDETPRKPSRRPHVDVEPVRQPTYNPDRWETGRIAGEAVLASLTSTFVGAMGIAGLIAGPVGVGILLLGPLATGGVVCGVGSLSDSFDGHCAAAIGGAYLGALLLIPGAFIGEELASGGNGEDWTAPILGALFGYVIGTSVGAVVGWNLSRDRRDAPLADVARLDALAAARHAEGREPPRRRGGPEVEAGARLTLPLLAFRF